MFSIFAESFENPLIISGKTYHHLSHVARIKVGETIRINIPALKTSYKGIVTAINKDNLVLEIKEEIKEKRIYPKIVLCQSILKGKRFALAIEKLTEVGVSEIVPLVTKRTIPKIDSKKALAKLRKWQTIAIESARQTNRPDYPSVAQIANNILDCPKSNYNLVAATFEKDTTLLELIEKLNPPSNASFTILVGPEGDFTQEEYDLILKEGYIPFTLGPNILRAETASSVLVFTLYLSLYTREYGRIQAK